MVTGRLIAGGVTIREGRPADGAACGRIFYEAFATLAAAHNLPCEPPSVEFTTWAAGRQLAHPGFVCAVAEVDGRVVGMASLDERSAIRGVGPVVVDPAAQDRGVGRALMCTLLDRVRERGAPGVRLVQTTYHYRSLALYAKLGFVVREPLSVMQGPPLASRGRSRGVRAATAADVDGCNLLCRRVHGHHRGGELRDAVDDGQAVVLEREGGIAGYATGFGYGGHAVAETDDDLRALLGAAEAFQGLGILVPTRNAALIGWCLGRGLRIVQQSTLMTMGLYNDPAGAYLPSIVY